MRHPKVPLAAAFLTSIEVSPGISLLKRISGSELEGQIYHLSMLLTAFCTCRDRSAWNFQIHMYRVITRGDRRENIYADSADKASFRLFFAQIIDQFNWVCYAYCLKGNHYHRLIQTPDANFSKGMRQLKGVYTLTYNPHHGKVGPFPREV